MPAQPVAETDKEGVALAAALAAGEALDAALGGGDAAALAVGEPAAEDDALTLSEADADGDGVELGESSCVEDKGISAEMMTDSSTPVRCIPIWYHTVRAASQRSTFIRRRGKK